MLSERFIDDMLRDSHAWRRAIKQCDVQDCLAPSSPAAKANMGPVFRRGCTDNVCSLRFVSTLRASADGLNRGAKEKALRQRMRGKWDPSTRTTNSQRDLLREILQHQLELHGFTTAYEASRDAVLEEQRRQEALYRQQRETRRLSQAAARNAAQQQELSMNESHMRQKLRDSERRKRASIAASMFTDAFVFATNTEFAERQAIFYDFQAQHASIVSEAANSLQSITGLPCSVFQSLVALQRNEAQCRKKLLSHHAKQHEFLKTEMHRAIDHQLKAEIAQVIAKEKLLTKIIQLSNQK
ncbi:uncharacterized protein Tco025E_07257 [Trypanosoma conorhini]|uniref:Uncharacterized protein n=1 Tax=Trypanosoma conorhini TaxID=83891 RepID=A0A422NRG1_9TRYP|nr:uncharacterized protein Tco025E_07257 [Trypanosoma conorhini]RNF08048.1 hypothetical protein Tco025E_07257 [Trypanosoma conorhini]